MKLKIAFFIPQIDAQFCICDSFSVFGTVWCQFDKFDSPELYCDGDHQKLRRTGDQIWL